MKKVIFDRCQPDRIDIEDCSPNNIYVAVKVKKYYDIPTKETKYFQILAKESDATTSVYHWINLYKKEMSGIRSGQKFFTVKNSLSFAKNGGYTIYQLNNISELSKLLT